LSDEILDPETLAAFLDGKLPPERRAAVLRLITRSPAAYELFAATAAAAAEMRHGPFDDAEPDNAAEEGGDAVTPHEPVRPAVERPPVPLPVHRAPRSAGRRLRRLAPLAAAAVVTAIAVVARFGFEPPTPSVLDLVSATDIVRTSGEHSIRNALGDSWDDRDWSVLRGPADGLPDAARAFRIGVGLVDFELAASVRDHDAAADQARELSALLADVDAGAPIASRYERWQRSIRASEPPSADARASAATSVGRLLDRSAWLDLGVWAEQARLAAAAGLTTFFVRSGKPARELAAVGTRIRAEGGRVAASAITAIEQALPDAAGGGSLEQIRAALDALFRASGG
jgi:hypothetical protein